MMDAESLEMLARSSCAAYPQGFGGAPAESPCKHKHNYIVDSKIRGGGYAGPVSRRIFCSHCRLQCWLDVEAALALTQADVGVIPPEAALEIAKAARLSAVDLQQITEGVVSTGHSLMPLLGALQRNCSPSAREYVHFGATTQDIQDTAQSLEMRDVLDETERALDILLDRLLVPVSGTRNALMVARAHSIPTLSTTFGLEVAGWIDELLRHRERLGEARKRILVVQLSGGVGTMAASGDETMLLLENFAWWLSLDVPLAGWHVSRDRVAEFISTLAMVTVSLARIVDEVRTLNRWEIGELEVGWTQQQIGSSTMLHKRNPEGCEQVVVLARLVKVQVLLALDAMIPEHERDHHGTRLEWCAITDVSHYTPMALSLLTDTIDGLTVHNETMARTANVYNDAICTEAFVFEMTKQLGRDNAYEVIFEITQACQRKRIPMRQALESDPRVGTIMPKETLARLLEPRSHLDMARTIVDKVLDKVASHHRITRRQRRRYYTSTGSKNDRG